MVQIVFLSYFIQVFFIRNIFIYLQIANQEKDRYILDIVTLLKIALNEKERREKRKESDFTVYLFRCIVIYFMIYGYVYPLNCDDIRCRFFSNYIRT